jgi:hypothetical protein
VHGAHYPAVCASDQIRRCEADGMTVPNPEQSIPKVRFGQGWNHVVAIVRP